MSDEDPCRNLISRVNIGDLLVRSAARAPGRLAVVDADRRFTYRAFNEWVNRTARGLAGLNYRRGDALALMSANDAAPLPRLVCPSLTMFGGSTIARRCGCRRPRRCSGNAFGKYSPK